MRVYLLCMVCLESIFWLRRHHPFQCPLVPRVGEKFLRSLRVINQLSTAKTFLRFSIAASAQQMHLLLPILVLCSAIFRRVFLALRPHRSLREPLLQLRCHHLALATQLALAQKSTFLKIFISFPSLIPCLIPPREEREMTERTTAQLPANKKCCLLIFAIAIGCLVLAAIPASSPPFSFLSTVMLCGVPETLVAFWGALCDSARENFPASTLYTLH